MVKKIKKLIMSYEYFGASDAMWLRLLSVIEKAVTGGGGRCLLMYWHMMNHNHSHLVFQMPSTIRVYINNRLNTTKVLEGLHVTPCYWRIYNFGANRKPDSGYLFDGL